MSRYKVFCIVFAVKQLNSQIHPVKTKLFYPCKIGAVIRMGSLT